MPGESEEPTTSEVKNETQKPDESVVTSDSKEQTDPIKSDVKLYKSIVLTAYGGSKHVRLESNEFKTIEKNQIAINVQACGINFLDIMMRQGLIDHPLKPPFVMGSECTGLISEVGEDVKDYKIGDPVIVLLENGAWTERLVLSVMEKSQTTTATTNNETENIINKSNEISINSNDIPFMILSRPLNLTIEQAAIIGFAYLPAYILLHHVASIKSNDIILIHSAGGGVGSAIGQLAKLVPNVTLIGTASKLKHEKLNAIYDVIIESEHDWVAEVKKLYPQGINVVLDCLSGEEINKSYGILKPLGKYILYGMSNLVTGDRKNILNLAKHWFHTERINPLRLYEDNRLLGGFSIKSLLFPRDRNPIEHTQFIKDTWNELIKLIDNKKIDPWVDSQWHFDEIKDAMLRLQERKNIGKVVLLPGLKEVLPEETKSNEQEKNADQEQAN